MSTPRLPRAAETVEAAERQIRELQKEIDYTVREYPIEVLVDRHVTNIETDENELFVPDYQRELVWDDKRQSRFIESLLIGLPIPYLFVADIANEDQDLDGRLEIIDGTQRMRTLARFLADDLELKDMKKLTALNGFVFSDLPLSRRRRFNRITLRLIELTEQANEETRRDMFDRINTGSVKLNDMEERRGSKPGPFVDLVNELAADPIFAQLARISPAQERRYEREELVARFFALNARYEQFGRGSAGKVVSEFVDEFVVEANGTLLREGPGGQMEAELRSSWGGMLAFVRDAFPLGFRKSLASKSTPRVRFEAISVGASRALAANPRPPGAENVRDWIDGPEFKRLTTSDAANNRSKVIGRIAFVTEKLLS